MFFGVAVFVVGAFNYTIADFSADAQESSARAVGLSAIAYMTIYNSYFWVTA